MDDVYAVDERSRHLAYVVVYGAVMRWSGHQEHLDVVEHGGWTLGHEKRGERET